ncbi:MAG: hypothetical protein HeimC3_16960 [Candidatus Heimdallarchaeota archaeon LC_3]|nr:MAG: hypothetical protein HeimC3_16960 [Candidatus Heimdallarchaeota archaeon LC_3]
MKEISLKYWILITGLVFFYSILLIPALETIETNSEWLGSGGSLFPIPIPSTLARCMSEMNIIDKIIYNFLIKTGIIIILNILVVIILILKIKKHFGSSFVNNK